MVENVQLSQPLFYKTFLVDDSVWFLLQEDVISIDSVLICIPYSVVIVQNCIDGGISSLL